MFRGLRADEIDVRVGSVSAKGVSLLLYKDARCDMNILDETVGIFNWKRRHIRDNANCVVSIWDDIKEQWISKEDTGTESYTEKEKGQASDSFKRACFNWGIGRELYTAGFTFVSCPTQKKEGGRGYELVNPYQFSGAYVSDIQYKKTENKREITGLVIKDSKGVTLYSKFARNQTEVSNKNVQDTKNKLINKTQLATVETELKRTGVKAPQILKEYKIFELKEMTLEQWTELMKRLEKVPTKQKTDLGL